MEVNEKQLEEIKKGSIESRDISKTSALLSQEQARGIQQISQGIMSIEEVVQNNSANAEQNAASSEELSTQAERLEELISYFKTSGELYSEEIYNTSTLALKESE